MLQRLVCIAAMLIVTIHYAEAQSNKEDGSNFGIQFKGYVKTDVMYDSRQNVTAREGHFLLYPAPELPDENGKDINAVPNTNLLSIQTRLTGIIKAPDVLGASTSGVIEGAFFGHSDGDINGFRLRHAYAKLDWQGSSLLIGQYWHPLFIAEMYPGVVSFNTGVPFQPFARNPQVRYTHSVGGIQASIAISSQRDFTSNGPDGASSKYLRNSAVPMVSCVARYTNPSFMAGAGAHYLALRPALSTEKNLQTDAQIQSLSALVFSKVTAGELSWSIQGIYSQNATDLMMLGGYAVSSTDETTGIHTYTNYNTFSTWTEIAYGKEFQIALFGGYTKNLGTDDPITGAVYARGANIDNVIRISPRVQYQLGKFVLASELEYTAAAYGSPDSKGKVQNTATVANTRCLLAAYLYF